MTRQKTNTEFLNDLKRVWGNEFEPLEDYKGYDKYIKVKHICGRILNKTPKNLIVQKFGCRVCENEKNGELRRKSHSWFLNEVKKCTGGEYLVLTPYTRSKDKVTMYHTVCDNEFLTTPDAFLGSRTGDKKEGNRCPFCSNKRKRDTHAFKAEVSELYRDEFSVIGVYKSRHKDILMRHEICQKLIYVRPRHFLDGKSYCMYCSNKEVKDTIRFKELVFQRVGREYSVKGEYLNARTPTLMQHNKCEKTYSVSPDNFLRGRRCPHCSDIHNSTGQRIIYEFLLINDIPFEREYRYDECRNEKPLPYDFAIFDNLEKNKVIALIEFDGEQHDKPSSLFGGEDGFKKRKKNDKIKNDFAKKEKIPLIRIKYKDLNKLHSRVREELSKLSPKYWTI